MAMTMKTAPHPKTHQNEIVAFAGLVHNSYSIDRSAPKPPFQSHFCAVAPPTNCIFPFDFRDRVKGINNSSGQSQVPSIEVIASERGLLGFILAKIHKVYSMLLVLKKFQ
jgi:DNA polymerase alpha subunit A